MAVKNEHMGVCVCYLLPLRAVAFHKVFAHLGFVGNVHVAVGTVVVVADSFQEVGTNRHLEKRHVYVCKLEPNNKEGCLQRGLVGGGGHSRL